MQNVDAAVAVAAPQNPVDRIYATEAEVRALVPGEFKSPRTSKDRLCVFCTWDAAEEGHKMDVKDFVYV
jgi:ribosomal protein S26